MMDLKWKPETFEEILAQDVIDHVSYINCKRLLRRCYRWLKPNGTLELHTPNLRHIATILSKKDHHEATMWLYGSDGEGNTSYPENVIRWCFSKSSLSKILEAIGFTIVYSGTDCGGLGLRIIAIKK